MKKRDLNLQLTVNQSQVYGDFISLKSVPDGVPHVGGEMVQLMVHSNGTTLTSGL
jgi:hypothetical protein